MTELEKEVREIAEYLGCNDGELWSEMSRLIEQEKTKARIDELENVLNQEVEKSFRSQKAEMINKITARISELKGE